jgi:hypothetical protein
MLKTFLATVLISVTPTLAYAEDQGSYNHKLAATLAKKHLPVLRVKPRYQICYIGGCDCNGVSTWQTIGYLINGSCDYYCEPSHTCGG